DLEPPARPLLDPGPRLPGAVVVGRIPPVAAAVGKVAIGVVMVLEGDGELPELVRTLGTLGGVAHLLDRRHQQGNEDGDDGNDNEQLDQREGGSREGGTGGEHDRTPLTTDKGEYLQRMLDTLPPFVYHWGHKFLHNDCFKKLQTGGPDGGGAALQG